MVIKIYISGISGNKEVKKRQQRVLMIFDSKNIKYDVVDITEPGNEDAKEFMQSNAKSLGATVSDTNPRSPLPPQIFNDEDYCGDYDQFDLANENDEIEVFLKLAPIETEHIIVSNAELKLENGNINSEDVQETKTSENNDIENENEPKEIVENEQNLENGTVDATDDTESTDLAE